jgi:hypothetical protein
MAEVAEVALVRCGRVRGGIVARLRVGMEWKLRKMGCWEVMRRFFVRVSGRRRGISTRAELGAVRRERMDGDDGLLVICARRIEVLDKPELKEIL